MRSPVVLALVLALGAPALAQTPPQAAGEPPPCLERAANLGGIGRASVVAFTAPITGAPVCATVANLQIDAFTARVGDAPDPDALVSAAMTGGGDLTLPLDGATVTGVGPYVVAPGGVFPSFGGDFSEAPRVIFAYAGGRVLVIATSAVSLVDMARALRSNSSLFGTDAVERAIVIASGRSATLSLQTASGPFGSPVGTPRILQLRKR